MAANVINTAFVKQFGNTLELLTQTKGGKFTGKCLEETIEGEEKYYDQLDSVIASEAGRSSYDSVTGNNSFPDSPDNFIEHKRRQVTATPYDIGLMLDRFDKVEMLVNPESQYVQQMVHALNRKKDIEFLKGVYGAAKTGKAGGGTAAELTSGDAVAKEIGTNSGMNIDKLIEARKILESNGVDLDDPLNKAYIAMHPKQLHQLLTDTKVTSSDFASVKALVSGDINSFYGFEFVTSNLIPFTNTAGTNAYDNGGSTRDFSSTWSDDVPSNGDSTGDRACFAWVHSGIRQVTNPAIETEIDKRADKRFNYYAYAAMRTGAVRMEEKKVVFIEAADSSVDDS
tara:strand:+ start:475 stop:1497 length:1023 start_codon:yes stop_codon:yes gene_type:complete